MEKFIPPEKRSKKEQRRLAAAKRGTWCGVKPVTRTQESKKVYNRKKLRSARYTMEVPGERSFFVVGGDEGNRKVYFVVNAYFAIELLFRE